MALLFLDESHFTQRLRLKRGFTPDRRPVSQVPRLKRGRRTVYGTIALTGQVTLAAAPAGNRFTFVAFLQVLQEEYAAYDVLLIFLDGASYHHLLPALQVFLRDRPQLQFIYFPPYSPECNPIEQLWRLVRKTLAGKYLETLDQVIDAVLDYDQTWRPSLCHQYHTCLA